MKRMLTALTFFLFGGVVFATTWVPSTKTDPLSGEPVRSHEIVSFGSYIYGWDSKFDIVYWPFIDENWICLNPKTGYGAFNNDFENLTEEDKKTVSAWLKENYNPEQEPKTHKEKLAWLEKVYAQRKMNDDFWSQFYRLMAYVHQDDEKTSMAYVKKAVPLLKKKLKSNPEGEDKLEVLYLLGEYHRRLGKDKKAKKYFDQVKDVKYKDEKGKEKVGHPYFVSLVEDRQKLMNEDSSPKPDAGDGVSKKRGKAFWPFGRRDSGSGKD
ncbi:MAG: DUF2225 domain-containing protein [Kiritimatiellia bacterium]|jgi:uncharacterized protein (DUF2225 family)